MPETRPARAPAKLNLGLRVFPARADGFHDLESWMVPLSWHDTVAFAPGGPLELVIRGRSEGIPTDVSKNLVGRAAVKLAEAGGIEPQGRLVLQKVVPPGGGMGGGSSDAANTLVLLNLAWRLHLSQQQLLAIAGELGSDVPFFVVGRPALCRGRGEIMSPLGLGHPLYAVLLLPGEGIATKPVYEAFDAGHRHEGMGKTDWAAWSGMTAADLNEVLINDLEPAALAIAPWLGELRERAAKLLGRKVHMTGSGSTLFTLCATGPEAEAITERLRSGLGGPTEYVPVRLMRHRTNVTE